MDLDCVMDSDYMEGYEGRRFLTRNEYAKQVRYLTDADLKNEFELILKEQEEQERRRTKSESMSSASSEGTLVDDVYRPSGYCCFCQKGKQGDTLMACDKCNKWDHAACAGISDEDTATRRYVCPICDPDANKDAPGYAGMLNLHTRQKRRLNRKRKRLDRGSDEWQPPAQKKRRNLDLSMDDNEDEVNLISGKSSKKKFNGHAEYSNPELRKLQQEKQKTQNQLKKIKKTKKKKKKMNDEFSDKSPEQILDSMLQATRELESIKCKKQYNLKLNQVRNEYEDTISEMNSKLRNVNVEYESFKKKANGRQKRHRETLKKSQQEFRKENQMHQQELEKCQDMCDQTMSKNMSLTAEVEQLKFELDFTKKNKEIELEKLRKKIASLETKDRRRSKEMTKLRKTIKKNETENIKPQHTPHRRSLPYAYHTPAPISGGLISGQLVSGTLFSPRRNMGSDSSESEDSSKSPEPILKQRKLNRPITKKKKDKKPRAKCHICGSKAYKRKKIFTCFHAECNKSYHLQCHDHDHSDYRNCPFTQKWFCTEHRDT